MGHTALVVLVGAFLTGMLLLFGIQRDTMEADDQLYAYHNQESAREAAMTGLNLTIRHLADDDGMGSWTAPGNYSVTKTSYNNGSFQTTVQTIDPSQPISGSHSGDTVEVVARGWSGNQQHVVYARYARDEDDKGIPPAFKNAITSDFYMQLKGNVGIFAIEDSVNASIHTNDDLTINGNSFLVEGYGTYTGSVNISSAASDNFIPNIDYNGTDPNHFWRDSVHVPRIHADELKQAAIESGTIINPGAGLSVDIDGDTYSQIDFTDPTDPLWTDLGATYNCPSGTTCGTAENPFVMYVETPLNFVNTIEVIGYGTIFSQENVTVTAGGSGGGIYGGLSPANETQVLLATYQDMYLYGNVCLGRGTDHGGHSCPAPSGSPKPYTNGITLYAHNSVEFQGTPYMVGGVVAKEATLDNGGNPVIVYSSAHEGTLDSGFQNIIPIGPILIAFSEWSNVQ